MIIEQQFVLNTSCKMILCLHVFLCCLVCGTLGNLITPVQNEMLRPEGANITLSCNYSSSAYSLQWYRQYPGQAPKYLFVVQYATGKVTQISETVTLDPRFSAKLNKEKSHVYLEISSAEVTDSAMFFCALVNNAGKMIFGTGTILTVDTKEKKKADVYKLQDSCLATDFTNHEDVKFEASVISATPVRYSGEKYQNYYSSFAWNAGNNCTESGGCKDGSSGSSDMEIDEKINFVSLGLFWLRILLLKTVVFNILMTFKAWMS